MKFGYTILYVKNVPASVAFYEDAFGLQRKFVHEEGFYAEMDTGTTTLAFAAYGLVKTNLPCGFQKNDPEAAPGGFEIALVTEDVAGAYQHAIDAGATAVTAPVTKPWGQICAFVRDRDGITVEICSPAS